MGKIYISGADTLSITDPAPLAVPPDSLSGEKLSTWKFKNAPGATDKGKWNAKTVYAIADCTHKPQAKDSDPDKGDWVANDGLPEVTKTAGKVGNADHAEAEARISFSADAPVADGAGFKVDGKITSRNQVWLDCDGTPWAKSESNGVMSIKGGRVSGARLVEGADTSDVKIKNKRVMGLGGECTTEKQVKSDHSGPIWIELEELETGIIVTEQIFDLTVSTDDFGTVNWDSTGIVLEAPDDGSSSVSMSGGFNSSWIVGGFGQFSAELSGGGFAATGEFGSLPWSLTYDGGMVVRAEVDGG